jgi:hypothetical protein
MARRVLQPDERLECRDERRESRHSLDGDFFTRERSRTALGHDSDAPEHYERVSPRQFHARD